MNRLCIYKGRKTRQNATYWYNYPLASPYKLVRDYTQNFRREKATYWYNYPLASPYKWIRE